MQPTTICKFTAHIQSIDKLSVSVLMKPLSQQWSITASQCKQNCHQQRCLPYIGKWDERFLLGFCSLRWKFNLVARGITNARESHQPQLKSVADPEGVQQVPWNPSFEGLPSKILCANVPLTLRSHEGYALQLHSCNNSPCVNYNFLYQEFDAHDLRVRIYYQKHMTTIETMSEARERMKAKVLFMHCSLCSQGW